MPERPWRASRRRFLASTALVTTAGCLGTDPGGDTESPRSGGTDSRGSPTDAGTTAETPRTAVADVGRFDDVNNWTAVDGSVVADDGDPFAGPHSIRLTCGESDKRAMGTYRPPQPVDLTGSVPTLAYRYGAESAGGNFVARLEAPDGDNRLVYKRLTRPGNGWIETPLSTPDEVVGDPDLGNVRRFTFYEYTGGGESVDIWLDGMALRERRDRAAVIFTFDDGHRSVAANARPILAEFDHAGSVATIPERTGRSSRLSIDQLTGLRDAGWDVMSHPQRRESLSAFDRERQEQLIADSKAWLEERGFERGARFFVYPYGRWDRSTLELVSEYHDAAFAGRGVTTVDPPMPLLTARIKGDDPVTVEAYLDRLTEYGGTMALMYHAVGSGSEWISTADFRNVVAAVDERDVDVLTVSDWADASHR